MPRKVTPNPEEEEPLTPVRRVFGGGVLFRSQQPHHPGYIANVNTWTCTCKSFKFARGEFKRCKHLDYLAIALREPRSIFELPVPGELSS